MENGAGASSAGALYWVAVKVIRDDWIAEWYAGRIVEWALVSGLRLTDLSAEMAREALQDMARAVEQAGYKVSWCTGGRQCFTLNTGGVLVTVQREGLEEFEEE